MRFGLFYEHQLPRPWREGAEQQLLSDALDQVELADKVGFDYVWEVEHHFLEEYSHSSAPEVFLAAASQRTCTIRLGHGIVQLPPAVNHPARVAERVATLDLVSGGRVDLGTGEGSSQVELGGFGVPRSAKREQWEESIDVVTKMLTEEPFAGHQGRWIDAPPRNVVPKPVQRPHPPLWVACSRRETIEYAARKGIGALSFSFVEPEDAKPWVEAYYGLLASEECVPAGYAVNPNLAVVLPFMCHPDEEVAIQRGIDGAHFFGYSLAHYYAFGNHRPGQTNIHDEFELSRHERGFSRDLVKAEKRPLEVRILEGAGGSLRGAIGTPDQVADLIARYQAVGVDQIILVAQCGTNRHEHIAESIELFGREVLPRFVEGREEAEAAKRDRLAEAEEAALARREPPRAKEVGQARSYVVAVGGEPRAARPDVAVLGRRRIQVRAVLAGRLGSVGRRLLRLVPVPVAVAFTLNPLGAFVIRWVMARGIDPTRTKDRPITVSFELHSNSRRIAWSVHLPEDTSEGTPKARGTRGLADDADVTISLDFGDVLQVVNGRADALDLLHEDRLKVVGDSAALVSFFGTFTVGPQLY